MTFKVKQAVKWKSIGNGSQTTKKGIIVAKVPAGKLPDELGLPQKVAKYLTGRHRRFNVDARRRKEDTFLVLVEKGPTSWLYWPTASHLQEA